MDYLLIESVVKEPETEIKDPTGDTKTKALRNGSVALGEILDLAGAVVKCAEGWVPEGWMAGGAVFGRENRSALGQTSIDGQPLQLRSRAGSGGCLHICFRRRAEGPRLLRFFLQGDGELGFAGYGWVVEGIAGAVAFRGVEVKTTFQVIGETGEA